MNEDGTIRAHTPKGVGKIGGIVNKAIYFQMIKGIIGAAMDGDIKRMAKESGILVGMIGVGAAGDMAVQWGRSILKRSSLLKGGSAYLGGILLSKAYLGFVIADLVARSKAYEMGDKDQLVAPTLTTNKNGNIVQQENNIIDMNSKTQVWSRAWPEAKQNLRIECASSGIEKQASEISLTRK
uniref:Uncharacterized protein n=1 Tax=Romanomermis culicivorax TaxID=13658 RepID=A0A915KDZ6_ROMCU